MHCAGELSRQVPRGIGDDDADECDEVFDVAVDRAVVDRLEAGVGGGDWFRPVVEEPVGMRGLEGEPRSAVGEVRGDEGEDVVRHGRLLSDL